MSSSTHPKKMSYSTALARRTKLPIKEISIKDWLKYYGLDAFYTTLFTKDKSYIAEFDVPFYVSYSADTLSSIKTNVQLIFTFANHIHFGEVIAHYMSVITTKMFNEGKITKVQQDTDFFLKELIHNFKLLKSQELEYKAYFSLAGLNPTKEHYEKTVVNSKLLNFLDHKSFDPSYKDYIKGTLRLLDFDDLLNSTASIFNLLLLIHYELLEKFNLHTTHKIANIKNGVHKTMTDVEFKAFIDGNEVLEFFESCDNLFDVKTIKRNLKDIFIGAKSFVEAHRIEIIRSLIQPRTLLDKEVTDKIYNTIFPNNDNIYINKQFQLIDDIIPASSRALQLVKRNKVRVFFIQAHGASCEYKKYESQPRVDFDKVFKDINTRYRKKYVYQKINISARHDKKYYPSVYDGIDKSSNIYELNNCMVTTTQPLGRLSDLQLIDSFLDIFSFKHRDLFIRGLLDATPTLTSEGELEGRIQLDILDRITTMMHYYIILQSTYNSRDNDTVQLEKEFEEFLKTYKPTYINYTPANYSKTITASQNIVNFIKYNHKYSPVDTTYNFVANVSDQEPIKGIFELNPNHVSDLTDLNMRVFAKSVKASSNDMKMGLDLESVYNFKKDIPANSEEILKYNKELKIRNSPHNKSVDIERCSLSEIIELIYTVGDIKVDEFVLIINNGCRGLYKDTKTTGVTSTLNFNTANDFSSLTKTKIEDLRIASIEGSGMINPPDTAIATVLGKSKRSRSKINNKKKLSTKRPRKKSTRKKSNRKKSNRKKSTRKKSTRLKSQV